MWQALQIALQDPSKYQLIIESSHIALAAFGGTFLFMVFISFFLDETKNIHRIGSLEKHLARLGKLESFEIVTALLVVWGTTKLP
jgi:uncharacterized protein